LYSSLVQAEDKDYTISIANKTYTVNQIIEDRPPVEVHLTINIILHNAGPDISDNITVDIMDINLLDQLHTYLNGSIKPGESKAFVFSDWIVIDKGEHIINISYYPTNTSIQKTATNSGKDTLIVQAGSVTSTSTPGFELFFLISALMITVAILKKKKKQ